MIDKVPIAVLTKIRKVPRDRATVMLEPFELTADEREKFLALALPIDSNLAKQPHSSYDPHKRTWLAAAHLLGASFRQLGDMHETSPQSVMQSITRILPVATRAQQRLALSLSLEKLSLYRLGYEANADHLKYLDSLSCANWLKENINVED